MILLRHAIEREFSGGGGGGEGWLIFKGDLSDHWCYSLLGFQFTIALDCLSIWCNLGFF
jgi:hypothetical protein